MDVLRTVQALALEDWAIGASLVRAAVWDFQHRLKDTNPLADIDAFYYDP